MAKVLYEKRERIAYVTINRPEVQNCIDPEAHALMWEIWRDFADDDAVELAILTGAGDESFCAGADLRAYISPLIDPDAGIGRRKLGDGVIETVRGMGYRLAA